MAPLSDQKFFKAKGPFWTAYWAWEKNYGSKMSIGTILGRLWPEMESKEMENIISDAFWLRDSKTPLSRDIKEE